MGEETFEDFRADVLKNGYRIIRITKDNNTLELFKDKPFINFLRKLLLTKYKTTYGEWRFKGGYPIGFNN